VLARAFGMAALVAIMALARPAAVPASTESAVDLPVGAYEAEGYFLPALGACRQAEHVPFGDQTVALCFGDAQPPPFPNENPNWIFYVLHNDSRSRTYQWQAWHGDFQTDHDEVRLCGRDGMIGLVSSGPTKQNRHMIQFFGDIVGSGRMYKFEMVWNHALGKSEPPPLQDQPIHCAPGTAAGSRTDPAALPWHAMAASVAPAPVARRGVNGVLMLGLGQQVAAGDLRLWDCLVNQGNYPGVHFVEGTSRADEWSYIWPDGRFRTVLDGGGDYEWRLAAPFRCGVARDQAFRAEFRVPVRPAATEEKLVLACIVADAGFSDCRSWWLERPQ